MDEKQIRKQTKQLLNAFINLTGKTTKPDFETFLLLRKAAISEIEENIFDDTYNDVELNKQNLEQKELNQNKHQIVQIDISKEKKVANETIKNKTDDKNVDVINIPSTVELNDDNLASVLTENTKLSDFEILREIKDNWN